MPVSPETSNRDMMIFHLHKSFYITYKQYTYRRVEVAFNNIYRKVFGILREESVSAIYVNNNIDSFGVLVRKNFIVLKHVRYY